VECHNDRYEGAHDDHVRRSVWVSDSFSPLIFPVPRYVPRKRFSQLAATLQLKGQVVKEKVSARRRSVYYQGLLKETAEEKDSASDQLQTEIDNVRPSCSVAYRIRYGRCSRETIVFLLFLLDVTRQLRVKVCLVHSMSCCWFVATSHGMHSVHSWRAPRRS